MLSLHLFESFKMSVILSKIGLIDLIILGFIVVGAIVGFMRGLAHQLPRFMALCVTTVVSIHYYDRVSALVTNHSSITAPVAQMASFVIIGFATFIAMSLLLGLCAKGLTVQFVYFFERVVGSLIGAARFLLIFSVVSFFITIMHVPTIEKMYKEESLSGMKVVALSSYLHARSVVAVKSLFASSKEDTELKMP